MHIKLWFWLYPNNSSYKIYKRRFTQKLHRIGIVVFNPSPLSRPPAQNQYQRIDTIKINNWQKVQLYKVDCGVLNMLMETNFHCIHIISVIFRIYLINYHKDSFLFYFVFIYYPNALYCYIFCWKSKIREYSILNDCN